MRSYLPVTAGDLTQLAEDQYLVVPPGATAVVPEDGDEESEYAALMTAADESTRLATEGGVPGLRRVVVVVEAAAAPESGARVELRDVAALHLDTADRATDSDPDDDLAWFAVQELSDLR